MAGRDRRGGHRLRLRRDRARGGQRPRRHEDHGRPGRGRRRGHRLPDQRPQAVDPNGGVADAYTILALAPGGPTWFVVEQGHRRLHQRQARGQARHPRCRTPPPSSSTTSTVPADQLDRRRRGQGPRPGAAGLRLHPPDGRGVRPGRRLGGAATARSATRRSASRPAAPLSREAGLHPQADRPPRRPARGRARRTSRRPPTRIDAGEGDDGALNTEGAIAKYLATEAGQRRRRRRHPGARRLRLHPRVHGREDQARRADHHDLRGHLGDHGDDDRPRPLAAAPQDPRASTTSTAAASWTRCTRRIPRSAGRRRRTGRCDALAGVLERLPGRPAHPQPARAASASASSSPAPRAPPRWPVAPPRPRTARCRAKADRRFDAAALAVDQPRVFAREAAHHGRPRRAALGHRAPPTRHRARRLAGRRTCAWTPSAPHRPGSSPTWTAVADALYDRPTHRHDMHRTHA